MSVCFDMLAHLLSESRYGPNGTPTEAHSRFMFLTEPAFPTSLWVSGVATPWNRITIIPDILSSTLRASFRCSNRSRRFSPRCCTLCMAARVSQAQEVQERPLLDVHGWTSVAGGRMPGETCTPVHAPFNPSNCGF